MLLLKIEKVHTYLHKFQNIISVRVTRTGDATPQRSVENSPHSVLYSPMSNEDVAVPGGWEASAKAYFDARRGSPSSTSDNHVKPTE